MEQNYKLIELLLSKETDALPDRCISDRTLDEWFNDGDIESQGALYVFLTESRFSRLLENRPSFGRTMDFLIQYFGRCIVDNPNGEWSDSRYSAARDIVNWVGNWVLDESLDRDPIQRFFYWIKEMKKHQDPDVQLCIEVGILEKLKCIKGVPDCLWH